MERWRSLSAGNAAVTLPPARQTTEIRQSLTIGSTISVLLFVLAKGARSRCVRRQANARGETGEHSSGASLLGCSFRSIPGRLPDADCKSREKLFSQEATA
jgi:hypothetical protein